MISQLHYITQDVEGFTHAELARKACEGGVRWVQLREKNKSKDAWLESALAAKKVCDDFGATLIINDNPQLAAEVGADGVHLGKDDIGVTEARKIVDNRIIGATANTFSDIERHAADGADYIGLGPFRFTSTKKNLSPLLGLYGYREIVKMMLGAGIHIPVIAIGGIRNEDVQLLFQTGVHGIAVSSAINLSADIPEAAKVFITTVNKSQTEK